MSWTRNEPTAARHSSMLANLRVDFQTPTGTINAVRGLSFTLGRERLGIVGEFGSGKSMTGRAILDLIPPPGVVTADRLAYRGQNLLGHAPDRAAAVCVDDACRWCCRMPSSRSIPLRPSAIRSPRPFACTTKRTGARRRERPARHA